MRNLLFISFIAVSLNLSAQKTSYGQLWESIETAEQQGEFKSLQPQLKAIYSKAKKEKNQQQAIKALLHLSRIRWETDDDDINRDYAVNLAVFNDFRSEIEQATGIEKLILQDYLAQMYAQYAQSIFNSYKNTTTVPSDSLSTDIRLWSKERYHKEITTLFETILANPDLLKNTPTENYATLLKNSEYNPCFPTLFDIFVADYLGYLNSFSRVHPTTFRNTRYGKISELYMQLADFHRNDADLTAWLHAKVQLITTRNRGNEAQAALELEALADANINQPYAAEVLYQAAQQLRNQSYTFYKRGISRQGTDPNLERNLHRLYTKALTEVPDSPWNAKAKNALTALEQKKITPSIPQFALPSQPIPLHISQLNADTLTFTLFRINTENVDFNKKPIWSDNSEFNSFVPIFDTEVETLYTKSLPIKKFNDYRTHAAYYSLEPLPKGSYTIQYIACGDTSSAFFAVSDILPVIQPTLNSEETIISFVNRKTGDPIKNQPFQLIEIAGTDSDDNTMPYWIVRNEGKTDKQGYYRTTFKRFNGEWPYLFNFPQLNEIVYIDINPTRWNTRPTPQKKQTQRNIEFFTDRAIYRPGQTVRCKGILSEVIDDKVPILPDSIVTIQLLDANGKVLQTVTRTANEFGSVEASFILPDMPVGNYALRSEGTIKGYKTFNVEEYKRPKFEVTINPSDRQYTLGQRVKVNGKAQSYAGAPLSNAEVTYTVTRSENWPWRTWDFFYMPTRSNEWEPIAQGEFSINPDGTFDFYFNAEAYNDTRNTNPRSYRYTVTVDVTDVNGETQSSSSHINVGTYPKTLALTLPQQIFESEPFIALLTSQNLNGLDTPSQGTVTVTRLLPDTPERPLLPNNQLTIDYQNLPYNEFTTLFPFIA